MKKKAGISNKIVYSKLVFFFGILVFVVIAFRGAQISLFNEIDHVNLKTMAASRNTKREVLVANRGTIYDVNKETLAQNVASYTVIAYLDPKRSDGFKTAKHVKDKQDTAEKLSPILGMSVDAILKLLSKNGYQVELGPGGRGITELKKDQIVELHLPGIDFVNNYKRYYPNGDFLSYVLGYAKQNENGEIIGEMGLEFLYNDKLKGENGYFEFQKDTLGYQIPNTPEIKTDPKNGEDIYLTIDSNVQRFLEQTVKANESTYHPEWIVLAAMDAKTGAILGSASTPSFNPNTRDIKTYMNPLISNAYEPGSTMKTYTYMASIEKGNYNGNDIFYSGEKQIEDQKVTDWKVEGWGNITFNQGYSISSNVGIANLIERNLSKAELKSYFDKLGFGKKTGITLPNEETGTLGFKYPIEVANAGFGQGITTTPIQHLKALTGISNNGILLEPYIIDKIVNPNSNEIVVKGKKKELGRVASEQTVQQMKQLMFDTVNTDGFTTANVYKMDGYDVIGKTGTAQISATNGGGYLSSSDVIYSFAGMWPKDDPKVILYAAMSRPTWGKNAAVVDMVRDSITDVSKYYNMFPSTDQPIEGKTFTLSSFINQKTSDVTALLNQKTIPVVVVGDGDKVIKQYPSKSTTVSSFEKVILVTNSGEKRMPNLSGYSTKEVTNLLDMLNVTYELNGNGFVTEQSIPEGSVVTDGMAITLTLAPKFSG